MKYIQNQKLATPFDWIFQILCCLGLILLLSSLSWAATPGDANEDGQITEQDVTAIINHILQIQTVPGTPDCNVDGVVNIQDVICVVNLINSQPPPDPSEVAPPRRRRERLQGHWRPRLDAQKHCPM